MLDRPRGWPGSRSPKPGREAKATAPGAGAPRERPGAHAAHQERDDQPGWILGVTIGGLGAGKFITARTTPSARRMPLRAIAGMIVPYPTLSDLGKWAAATYFMSGSASGWARRLIRVAAPARVRFGRRQQGGHR